MLVPGKCNFTSSGSCLENVIKPMENASYNEKVPLMGWDRIYNNLQSCRLH